MSCGRLLALGRLGLERAGAAEARFFSVWQLHSRLGLAAVNDHGEWTGSPFPSALSCPGLRACLFPASRPAAHSEERTMVSSCLVAAQHARSIRVSYRGRICVACVRAKNKNGITAGGLERLRTLRFASSRRTRRTQDVLLVSCSRSLACLALARPR